MFVLEYTLSFTDQNFVSLNIFQDCFKIQRICLYVYHQINYFRYSSWLLFCCRQRLRFHQGIPILGKTNFCANRNAQLHKMCHVIQSNMFISRPPMSFPGPFTATVSPFQGQLTIKNITFSRPKCSKIHIHTTTMADTNNTSQWEAPKFSFSTTNEAKEGKTFHVRALNYHQIAYLFYIGHWCR